MKIGVIPQRHQASLEKGKTASWNHLLVAKLLIFASACQYTVTC